MTPHSYRFSQLLILLLCIVCSSLQAQIPVNCASSCNHLVGYVNFANKNGIETGRWSIDDIDYSGYAIETLTTTGNYQASGDLITTNDYFIVKNPSSVKGGNGTSNAETLQNVQDALGGVFLIRGNSNNNSLIYTITGLNKGTDAKATYCIRIKMRNVGRASQTDNNDKNNACQENGNNIRVALLDLANNNKAYRAGQSAYGTYTTINTENCTTNVTANWTQNQQQNTMTRYGDMTIFEGAITTGTDDGFKIQIRGINAARNTITGIESIEVFGCLPSKLTAEDAEGNQTSLICENETFTLKVTGTGFGENIQWYKGSSVADALASVAIGNGNEFQGRAAVGVGTSEWYVAKGGIGQEAIEITSIFCCPNTVTVFTEEFPLDPATSHNCGTTIISALAPGRGTTSYGYTNDCSLSPEGLYAIVTKSEINPWATRTIVSEHSNKENSGAMLVNAASNTSQYFYEKELNNICSNTQYEFSAWYASVANPTEGPSDITFEIRDNNNHLIASVSTGDFGGTAGSTNPDATSFVWRKKTLVFQTNTADNFWVKLRNSQGGAGGNDLLIDDIVVTKCMPNINIESGGQIGEITTCSTTGVELKVNAAQSDLDIIAAGSLSGNIYYQWAEVSDNGNWTLIGTVQELLPAVPAVITTPSHQIGSVQYQVKISSDPVRAANWGSDLATSCGNDIKSIVFKVNIVGGDHISGKTDGERCGEGTVELKAATYPAGGTVNWYKTETGNTFLGSSNDGELWTTPIITENTTYYAELAGGTCATGRTPVVAAVVNSIGGTASADQSICHNTMPADLTLSGYSGNIMWQLSDNGTNWTYEGATEAILSSETMGNLTETRYYRAEVKTGTCAVAYSNTVEITVTGTPTVGDIVSPNYAHPIGASVTVVCDAENIPSISMIAPTVTPNGSTITAQYWEMETVADSENYSRFDVPYTVYRTDNEKLIRYTVESSCGLIHSNSVLIIVGTDPTVGDIMMPEAVCSGENLNLNSTPPKVANGYTNYSSSRYEIETVAGSGVFVRFDYPHTVTYMDNRKLIRYAYSVDCGNTAYSNAVSITVTDKPTVTLQTPAPICTGNNLIMTANANSNGSAITAYSWKLGGVEIGTGVTLNQQVTDTDNGKKLTLEVTNACGTTASSDVVITVNNLPTFATFNSQTICSGTKFADVNLSGGSNPATSYTWTASVTSGSIIGFAGSGTGSTVLLGETLTNTGTANGVVTYTLTPLAGDCEGTTVTFNVTVLPAPTGVWSNPPAICSGSTFADVLMSSAGNATSYRWTASNTNGVIGYTADGTSTNTILLGETLTNNGTISGVVTYRITPRTSNETSGYCEGIASDVQVTVHPIPALPAVANVTYCAGAIVPPLVASGSSLKWYNDNDPATLPFNKAPIPNTETENVISYWVSQTVNGCESARAELRITIIEALQIALIAQNEIGATLPNNTSAIKRGVRLEAISIRGEIPQNYVWSWDNITLSGNNELWVHPIKTTTYSVVAKLDETCSTSAKIEIKVKPLPTAFIPSNGEGDINSVFPVTAEALDQQLIKYKNLTIYNRYGQEVYNGEKRWDGTVNGKELAAPGTYFYIITFDDGDTLKGTIEVIKNKE